jgi:hypothetical protein
MVSCYWTMAVVAREYSDEWTVVVLEAYDDCTLSCCSTSCMQVFSHLRRKPAAPAHTGSVFGLEPAVRLDVRPYSWSTGEGTAESLIIAATCSIIFWVVQIRRAVIVALIFRGLVIVNEL